VIYVDEEVEYAGKIVGGLRVRAPKGNPAPQPHKPVRESENPAPVADDFDNDLPFN
jgi:hypothetical protein